jgi:hypothetical protein
MGQVADLTSSAPPRWHPRRSIAPVIFPPLFPANWPWQTPLAWKRRTRARVSHAVSGAQCINAKTLLSTYFLLIAAKWACLWMLLPPSRFILSPGCLAASAGAASRHASRRACAPGYLRRSHLWREATVGTEI